MENASKALILAGAILIAIMLVSLGVLLFNNVGGAAKKAVDMDEQEISNFNSKITPYLGKSVPGSQVNALLQYCVSVNISAKKSGETYKAITVNYNGGSSKIDKDSQNYTKVTTGIYYNVSGTNDSNGLITSIEIK